MKFCTKHWEKLSELIKQHGMWHLVAGSGEEVARRMRDAEEMHKAGQEMTLDVFEPLMMSHNMICMQAIKVGGDYMMAGDFCPVCEAMKGLAGRPKQDGTPATTEDVEVDWTENVVSAVANFARERGFIGTVN
jgi:hypothetical protein